MKALTICQPWAWAIAKGFKLVENRSWPTKYRGPLAIHAGLARKWIDGGRTHLWEAAARFERPEWKMPDEDALVYGAIVAVADVVDCIDIATLLHPQYRIPRGPNCKEFARMSPEYAAFAGGPVCWVLANVRPIKEPIKYRGAQGLFDLDEPTSKTLAALVS
jgi:activating signal cointegrator 1